MADAAQAATDTGGVASTVPASGSAQAIIAQAVAQCEKGAFDREAGLEALLARLIQMQIRG
jgi:hypothetical protein